MVNAALVPQGNVVLSGLRLDNARSGIAGGVGVQRKVFRVEQMIAGRRSAARAQAAGERADVDRLKTLRGFGQRREMSGAELERELALVRETIAHNRHEVASLIGTSNERRMARAAGELGAAVVGMENATQTILHAAEAIDDDAKALAAALRSDYERGLLQDIQERTVAIYEASNFQDLAGQRIAKVIATLNLIEQQLAAMLDRCNGHAGKPAPQPAAACGLINGPKLDGDSGHAEQRDIDAMFG
jgi:chemotaxis protein CheZ